MHPLADAAALPLDAIAHAQQGLSRRQRLYEDIAQVYREEIAALYDAGCRYLQIDETNIPGHLSDPALRDAAKKEGEDPDELVQRYAKLINDSVRDAPDDMTVCVHMCRGNHAGGWFAEGGYDPVAVSFREIDVDGFFLEYDTPRAGSFAPLAHLGKGKVAVLGLVTTKSPKLESKEELMRRIDEAAKYVPPEYLALSPQCGFASTIEGNPLTQDDQKRKLQLVAGRRATCGARRGGRHSAPSFATPSSCAMLSRPARSFSGNGTPALRRRFASRSPRSPGSSNSSKPSRRGSAFTVSASS